jgi:hypothetical protein
MQATVQVVVGMVGENPDPNVGKSVRGWDWNISATSGWRPQQNFLDDLSNSGPAVRLYREGTATGPPADRYRRPLEENGEIMTQ